MVKEILEKSVNANPEKVFKAFSDAEELSYWFTPGTKIDLKIGGSYINSGGDKGMFLEIIPNQKLKYTWDNEKYCPGTIVTIDFEKSDSDKDKTKITITHSELKSKEDGEIMREGWQWTLVNFKSYIETGKIIPYEEWKENQK